MNYYRRYIGDYLAKTGHLSLAEHGAYTVMLDVYYSTEKPLPASLDALCRLCRAMTKVEQQAVKTVAEQFFPISRSDGLRRNPRAAEEIGKAQLTIAKQRESGVEASRKRWNEDGSTDRSTHRSTYSRPSKSTDRSTNQQTDESTHAPSIQPPTSNHQPPNSIPQPPTANHQENLALAPESRGLERRSLASRLPDGWTPSPEQIEWALTEQPAWSSEDVRKVSDKFRDYWKSLGGAKARKADWNATWRNWIRNEPAVRTAGATGTSRTVTQQDDIERLNRSIASNWTPPGGLS